ncbi:hypothetical protein B0A55_07352 [Friedmanniomyces simplex]|uniref:Uncharacterized protein n=1 Tax=Friedmanniomyces simplex TaxID=329884 RepID=A0A4U0WXP3_9PEZI|nr:hypothetical protein B0A55_07352 [Friedmanniomyces simplex]
MATAHLTPPPKRTLNKQSPTTPPFSEATVRDNGEIALVRGSLQDTTDFADAVQRNTGEDASPDRLRSRRSVLRLPASPQYFFVNIEDQHPAAQTSDQRRDSARALEQYAQRMPEGALTHNGRELKAKATTAVYTYNQLCYNSAYTRPAEDVLREIVAGQCPAVAWGGRDEEALALLVEEQGEE